MVVNFLDPNGRLEKSFDFSIYGTEPRVAAEIALAFRNHHAGHSPATREGAFNTLRRWFSFINEHLPAITSMREVDTATLRAFIAWLDAKPWTKSSRHGSWSVLKQ
ncbi:MAG: site-specific integrase, partial [Mesorhizobium sp.]